MSNITEERVAPCPWCEPEVAQATAYNKLRKAGNHDWRVECPGCGCSGPRGFDTEAQAIATWNRRASPPVLSEEQREALEAGASSLATTGWIKGESTPPRLMAQAALLRAMAERGK